MYQALDNLTIKQKPHCVKWLTVGIWNPALSLRVLRRVSSSQTLVLVEGSTGGGRYLSRYVHVKLMGGRRVRMREFTVSLWRP